ncbi:MAG: TIGR02302 family protein [Xanthobacteraceae bacterium]
MTDAISDNPTPPRDSGTPLLAAALKRARWAILWERIWPPLAALATVIGLFLALSWLGLWLWLPPLARAFGLLAFAGLAFLAAVPFAWLRMPGTQDGLRRLDRDSGLRHRPATTIADRLAVSAQDSYSLALWHAHLERARTAAGSLKAGLPSPRVAWRDPYALRGLVLLACIATFFAAGGERIKRIAAAFDWQGVVLPANFRVDAWVIPPLYTGKPPVMLPGLHGGERFARLGAPVSVPVNSTLVVRATGDVDLDVSAAGGVVAAKAAAGSPAGTQEHRFTIKAAGSAALRGVGDDVTWAFDAIPDLPPTIALTKKPEEQGRGSLLLSYQVSDDYGVTKAEATFAIKNDKSKLAKGAHPLFGPPDFSLILPQARARKGVAQTMKDLTDHPWAGAEVTMRLVAHDDGGNIGKSAPLTFRLPERVFTKPLARALVEQRRILALDASSKPIVLTALDALATAPDKFMPDPGTYLGLRAIYWKLVRADSDDELRDVVKRLWSMAVDIEDGNMADAQTALRNAEQALRQALANGASDQEIKQLMDKLRAAMNRYMQALAQQLRNKGELSRPLDPNARVLSRRDLQQMLDRLENLARSGSREAAQQLLSQLEQMMENLQMASPQMNGGDDQMMSDLDHLGDMIRRQQDLRDRTFKQGQGQRGQGAQPGQQGQSDQGMGQLQHDQQALRDRLNKLLDELRQHGLGRQQGRGQDQGQGQGQDPGQDGMSELGRAGKAMGEAEGDLGQSDADSAVDAQGRALDALRKGAQSMAQAMQQQRGRGQGPGRIGRFGQSRDDQETDPLGRPLRGHDYGDDSSVKVPGDIDVQRARRIIDELRRRFGEIKRSQQELDYIERLLKNY